MRLAANRRRSPRAARPTPPPAPLRFLEDVAKSGRQSPAGQPSDDGSTNLHGVTPGWGQFVDQTSEAVRKPGSEADLAELVRGNRRQNLLHNQVELPSSYLWGVPANCSTNPERVPINERRGTKPSRASSFRMCSAIVAVGTSRRKSVRREASASLTRSSTWRVFPEPVGPVRRRHHQLSIREARISG